MLEVHSESLNKTRTAQLWPYSCPPVHEHLHKVNDASLQALSLLIDLILLTYLFFINSSITSKGTHLVFKATTFIWQKGSMETSRQFGWYQSTPGQGGWAPVPFPRSWLCSSPRRGLLSVQVSKMCHFSFIQEMLPEHLLCKALLNVEKYCSPFIWDWFYFTIPFIFVFQFKSIIYWFLCSVLKFPPSLMPF